MMKFAFLCYVIDEKSPLIKFDTQEKEHFSSKSNIFNKI